MQELRREKGRDFGEMTFHGNSKAHSYPVGELQRINETSEFLSTGDEESGSSYLLSITD